MNFKSTLFVSALLNAVLALPLTMGLGVASGAEMSLDPAIGTWALNLNKSKLDASSPAPKSSVRTYTATPDGLKVVIHSVTATSDRTNAKGTKVHDVAVFDRQ